MMAVRRVFAGLLVVFALSAPALAQQLPALTGRVVDQAAIIPAEQKSAIEQMLAEHEAKTGEQVVVATVSSLGGREIEEYGVDLARAWALGQKGKNNGVLMLVAPNERAVRIEVGYGLEGELTDAISKLIIEGSILPRFKAGDMPGGIRRGVDDIIAVLSGNADAFAKRAKERVSQEDSVWSGGTVLLFMFVMFVILKIVGGGRRRRYGGGPWGPIILGGGGGFGGGSSGGGFSGGGGSFGGGGASGRW